MVDTSSEQFRASCEARWLSRRTPNQITEFLAMVEKARGKAARDKLRADTVELWLAKPAKQR